MDVPPGRLRRYDVQADYAWVLAAVSIAPFLVAAGLLWRNMQWELGRIMYRSDGLFLPAFFVCLGASIAPAATGFLLGWSSAGQRRNDRPMRSWIGFFVGGGVLTLNVILMIAFLMLQLPQSV
ncbi:MAG: hypothetical protein ACE5HE_10685 [Phycisphaerae bacterium]